MEEVFRPIEDFDNYEVSNFGNVRNKKTEKLLKKVLNTKGYYKLELRQNSKRSTLLIHRLVALTFIDNPDEKPSVDHIDNNRTNNNVRNLRWCTSKENQQNSKLSRSNTSGHKGVCWDKHQNKWRAQIKIDGIKIHLGSFEDKENAIRERVQRANQAFGVFVNACERL
jgi:hypothetical protein